MATAASENLAGLYLQDETAWLEAMAGLIRAGRLGELDYPNLADYLSDMAKRDRREVVGRLTVLIAHLLKSRHQPERRSKSWARTILVQRQQLEDIFESGVLRAHAAEVLSKAHARGVKQAVAETGLPRSTFPEECPFTLVEVLDEPPDSTAD